MRTALGAGLPRLLWGKGSGIGRIFGGVKGALCTALAALLLLSGCNPDSGAAFLEVVYPSGYVRTDTTWDELTPVEGTGCRLRARKAADYDKTYHYNLQFLDEAGKLLWELPDVGRPTMRGEAAEGGAAWICGEWWDTVHCNGYLNGHLSKSIVMLVDMMDGTVLFQAEAGENELYLTSRGSLCYFYKAGKPGREDASIYCRDIQDWETKETIYTFDYAVEPEIAGNHDSMRKARFILDGGFIKVVWESTDRVLTSKGTYQSVFSEKVSYEIPIPEAAQTGAVDIARTDSEMRFGRQA